MSRKRSSCCESLLPQLPKVLACSHGDVPVPELLDVEASPGGA